MSEVQKYKYLRDTHGMRFTFHKKDINEWVEIGGTYKLAIGIRDEYYDYSF
jgi:hypothetical protein